MRLGSEERAPVEIIPTGSIALDVALGIGAEHDARTSHLHTQILGLQRHALSFFVAQIPRGSGGSAPGAFAGSTLTAEEAELEGER